jgi:hypothetical protein
MKYIKLFENFAFGQKLPVVPEGWTKDSVDPDMIKRSIEASKKREDQVEKEFQEIKDNHLKFLDMKFVFPMEIPKDHRVNKEVSSDGENDYVEMSTVPENIVKLFKNAGKEVHILGNESSFPKDSEHPEKPNEKIWIWFEILPFSSGLESIAISIGKIPNGATSPRKWLEITFNEEKDEFVLCNEYTDKYYDVGFWFNDEVVDECLFLLENPKM